MAAAQQGVAFDEFTQGGLLDDADVTIQSARFVSWDYNGKQPQPILALKVDMLDNEGTVHDQYLSCGELRFFVPSADGKVAVAVGSAQKLNLNTNAVTFLLSVMNADTKGELTAAFKKNGDVSLLDGLKMHVIRKAQPKRAGIIAAPGMEGQPQREKTTLICEKILAYADGTPAAGATVAKAAAPAKTATAAPAAAAPAAAAGVASEVEDQAVGALCSLLGENGGSLAQTAIAGKFFSSAAIKEMGFTAPVKNAILGVIVKPEFLGAADRPWKFDAAAKTVTLG